MAMETYFDFDAETFQITERKRLSGSSGEVLSPPGFSSPYFKSSCSEDAGFETSSDRSSQDGVSLSPRSPCLKTPFNSFSCSTCPKSSLDSLVSRPIRRYDSKESIKSTSSFWDSNFPPETKAVLSKIRDQMRSSLDKVKNLEEAAKQIPLLQVKISTLQEEKRQLIAQLESRNNIKKSRSRSSSINRSRSSSIEELFYGGFQDKETRSIGVGKDTIHDILCETCKEIQSKLLGHSCSTDFGCSRECPSAVKEPRIKPRENNNDDDIKVFQDRCTQTITPQFKNNYVQATVSTQDSSTSVDLADNSSVQTKNTDTMTKESSCQPIPVVTRSIGVGQIKSYLKDACAGNDQEIPSYVENGIQNVVTMSDKSCGVQVATQNIGVNVCPSVVSIGTACLFDDSINKRQQRTIGCQTIKEHANLVSIGVGMFSVDDTEVYQCSKCNSEKSLTIDEILELNKNMYEESTNVAVETLPWMELKTQILLEHHESQPKASVVVGTSIDSRTVGCGDQSVTDKSCENCSSKSTRSLGVNCSPKLCDKAVGDTIPETCSVGVGECCLTDNYCERCFSLQTRTIGIGNGSVLDTVQTDITSAPTLTDVSLQPLTPPQTPNAKNETKRISSKCYEENITAITTMFSDEYERVESELIEDCADGRSCNDRNSAREDILLTCKLVNKHFLNDENMDEDKLLLCMKNIEDYWFTCVTDERLDKESLAKLMCVLEQHLPYLLEGIINSQDEHGNTALHYMVTYGKFDCMSELLKTNYCNVIITNKAGYSAVMLGSLKEAVEPKDEEVLKQLFEKGNLHCTAQTTGQTPLMLAAGTGNLNTVDLLLQCGASQSINTKDLDGSTALMCACEHGYAKIVKRILTVDACDATVADHDGSTSFSIAMEHNRKDIALMIYNHIQVQNSRTPNKKK